MTFALLRFLQFLLTGNAGINLPHLDLSLDPLALDIKSYIPTKCTMINQLKKLASYQNWARIEGILNKKQETIIFDKTSMSMFPALSCMTWWWTCRRGRWSSMASPCWRRLSPVTTFLFIITMKQGTLNHVITL